MKILTLFALLLSSSTYASRIYTRDANGGCILPTNKGIQISVKPIPRTNQFGGGLIGQLRISTSDGKKAVYELFGRFGGWDEKFKLIQGDAIAGAKYLAFDDFRGLAFYQILVDDVKTPVLEAYGATYLKEDGFACERPHGELRFIFD